MELGAAGLKEQPFRTHGRPVVFVSYAEQENAFKFLKETYEHNSGLGLLQGPTYSGKTTIIRRFAELQKAQSAVAVINGAGLNATSMLESVLREFGYEYKFDTINELQNMLKVFIQQQTVSDRPPLLMVENIHEMNPSALRVLCELATVRIREKYALRIILISDRPIDYIVKAPAMECMSKRLTGSYHLGPLTIDETSDYLHSKMRHAGCLDPALVLTNDICDELYRASGGWPGVLDRLALLAIANAERCPVGLEHIEYPAIPQSTRGKDSEDHRGRNDDVAIDAPALRLTHNGKTLQQMTFGGSRLLIGRSEHNDLQIESTYISRHHVLLVRHGAATLLMDLNSANGTYVNSWRVSNQMLANGDLIMLGEHGIQFIHESAPERVALEGVSFDDTTVRETIKEMGRILGHDDAELMPERSRSPEQTGDSA